MRTYDDARFDEDEDEDEEDYADDDLEPDINDHRFLTPDDVREWVRRDFLMSCKAYNEVWLLDGHGAYVGCWTSRSVVKVRDLAADPSKLLHATELARAEVEHPHWVVFENREGAHGNPRPTEADVQAFVTLGEVLAPDATVVDAVILGERRLWSLHEKLMPGQPYALRAGSR